MAKTNRPLRCLFHHSLKNHSDVLDLMAKGNEVEFTNPQRDEFDLIAGPQSWRIVPGMEDQMLPMAIKSARKVRYGKASNDAT